MPGTRRGKTWTPPAKSKPVVDDDIEIALDLGEDVELALSSATTEEIVDLAGWLPYRAIERREANILSILRPASISLIACSTWEHFIPRPIF